MKGLNVSEFGALGDGVCKDTESIQLAIDECGRNGGGLVYIPPGTYQVGTLFLKSNLTLYLEAGAVLFSSTDKEDFYFATEFKDCNNWSSSNPAILYGQDVSSVTIRGKGKIVGRGQSFWTPKEKEEIGEGWNSHPPRYWAKEWRPISLLLRGSNHITIEGITIEDSPVFSGWLIDCERVSIRDVHIMNDFYGPNADGFHLSSCRYVHIADSHFHTGDDCIAIDGSGTGVSENYTISNCTFHTSVNVFRIYTGLDPWLPVGRHSHVRNISISNCSVSNAAGILNITAENGTIEGVTMSNITATQEQEGTPIFIMTNSGTVRNVSINHMFVKSDGACTITGQPEDDIDNIILSDIHFDIAAKRKKFGMDLPVPFVNYADHHFAPYNLYFRNANRIKLINVSINWLPTVLMESWSALKCININEIEIDGFRGKQAGDDIQVPVFSFENVKEASISRSKALAGTGTYLSLSGYLTERIVLSDNDMSYALIDNQIESEVKENVLHTL